MILSFRYQTVLLGAVFLLALPVCSLAQDQISREDTAAILFSNHFAFTDSGEPVLSVSLTDDQETVAFSSKKGITFQPSGPSGPTITVKEGGTWTARIKEGKPAVLAYRVVLDKVPTREFEARRKSVKIWKERKVETTAMELGTVFSFEGSVFDSRVTLVCAKELFKNRKEARKLGKSLGKQYNCQPTIESILDQRPTGTIEVSDARGTFVFKAANALWFQPLDNDLTIQDVEYGRGFNWHGRQTRRYAGQFYLAVGQTGKLAVVNVLPSEKLLKGLVPAEIYASSPKEALKAQAVAARNELFSKIGHRHLADPYLLCSQQHCQVYKGLSAERRASSKAVDATRGMLLFNGTGRLADCRYHSTCGGHTEDAHEAWPGVESAELKGRHTSVKSPADPYSRVPDDSIEQFIGTPPVSYCSKSSKSGNTFRWTKTVDASKLNARVKERFGLRKVEVIEVLHRGVSGRANQIRLSGVGKTIEVKGELVIRKLFFGLRSSMFVVKPVKSSSGAILDWRFEGGGFGHGVGMCQLGAAEMARFGKTFKEILQYYYRQVRVQRIY